MVYVLLHEITLFVLLRFFTTHYLCSFSQTKISILWFGKKTAVGCRETDSVSCERQYRVCDASISTYSVRELFFAVVDKRIHQLERYPLLPSFSSLLSFEGTDGRFLS